MELRKSKRIGRPPNPENRTRTRNLVIRLSDKERKLLDQIAKHHDIKSASAVFRFLIHREADTIKKH